MAPHGTYYVRYYINWERPGAYRAGFEGRPDVFTAGPDIKMNGVLGDMLANHLRANGFKIPKYATTLSEWIDHSGADEEWIAEHMKALVLSMIRKNFGMKASAKLETESLHAGKVIFTI